VCAHVVPTTHAHTHTHSHDLVPHSLPGPVHWLVESSQVTFPSPDHVCVWMPHCGSCIVTRPDSTRHTRTHIQTPHTRPHSSGHPTTHNHLQHTQNHGGLTFSHVLHQTCQGYFLAYFDSNFTLAIFFFFFFFSETPQLYIAYLLDTRTSRNTWCQHKKTFFIS
jgi:hypothetical protein